MATATSPLPSIFSPLQALAAWLAQPRRADRAALPPQPAATPAPQPQAARSRPLRVLRVVEGRQAAGAGRMVISGRLADVCAELDRLAEQESARR